MPIAAYAHFEDRQLHLTGRVCSHNGLTQITLRVMVAITDDLASSRAVDAVHQAGFDLARAALEQGATALLEVA